MIPKSLSFGDLPESTPSNSIISQFRAGVEIDKSIIKTQQTSQEFSGEDVLVPLPDLTDCLEKIEQRYDAVGDLAIFILSSARVPPFTGVGGTV